VDAASSGELMLPRQGSPSKASIGQNNNNNWRLKLVGNSVGTELDNGLVLSKTRLPFTETWLAWNKNKAANNEVGGIQWRRKPLKQLTDSGANR